MARTQSDFYDLLSDLAHPIFTDTAEGRAILNGLALVLSGAEAAWDAVGGWREQLFRQTAEGDWLDQHGDMNGEPRPGGRSDDDYRDDAALRPKIYTRTEAQRDQNSAIAPHGEGYSVDVREPLVDCAALDISMYLDTAGAMLMPPIDDPEHIPLIAWFHYPMPEAVQIPWAGALGVSAYLDLSAFLADSITDPDRAWLVDARERADAARPLGVGYGATLADYWQENYWDMMVADDL